MASAQRAIDAGNIDGALEWLRAEVRRRSPTDEARALLELAEGLAALRGGDRMEAAQRFEAVLELDPSSERAARELAEMRRQAVAQRRGLLSKLMSENE